MFKHGENYTGDSARKIRDQRGEIGRGGFSCVYRALDVVLGREVAIKVLLDADADLRARFLQEAKTTAGLNHPNIVTAYDFGEQDGQTYIVMELLEGETLDAFLRARKQIPLLQKVRILEQVANALSFAHTFGVVHRDVKPANIAVLPGGTVKVMDFGIARLSRASNQITAEGMIVGTVNYMAPEVFKGEVATKQSDVFAFGAVAYELLTGVQPFHAPELAQTMYHILSTDPTPIRKLVADIPEALERMVDRSLAKVSCQPLCGLWDRALADKADCGGALAG